MPTCHLTMPIRKLTSLLTKLLNCSKRLGVLYGESRVVEKKIPRFMLPSVRDAVMTGYWTSFLYTVPCHYLQMNDDANVADSLVTKGVCYGRAVPEQLKVRKRHRICIFCQWIWHCSRNMLETAIVFLRWTFQLLFFWGEPFNFETVDGSWN